MTVIVCVGAVKLWGNKGIADSLLKGRLSYELPVSSEYYIGRQENVLTHQIKSPDQESMVCPNPAVLELGLRQFAKPLPTSTFALWTLYQVPFSDRQCSVSQVKSGKLDLLGSPCLLNASPC